MIRSVPFLIGACLLSIALGFLFGKGTSSDSDPMEDLLNSHPTKREQSTSTQQRARTDDRGELLAGILNGRNSRDIPASELAEIIGKLTKSNTDLDAVSLARRSYQLQMLLAQLSVSQLEEIATAVAADKDAKEGGAIRTILANLSEKDPDRALEWAASQGNSSGLLSLVISEMATADPIKASELLRESLINGSIEGNSLWQASFGISRSMAKLGAMPLIDFMDTLPQRYQSSVIYSTISSLPDGQEKVLLDEFYRRNKSNPLGENQLEYAFAHSVTKNPEAAEAWLNTMPDGDVKNSLLTGAADRLAQSGDIDGAKVWLSRAFESSPGEEKKLFIEATQSMSYNNPEAIAKIAAALPPGIELTAEDLSQSANQSLHNGTGALASVANAIRNPDEKAKLITNTLGEFAKNKSQVRQMSTTDFEILTRRINDMGFSGANLEKVTAALDAAKNSGKE